MNNNKKILYLIVGSMLLSFLISISSLWIVNIFASQTVPYGINLGPLNLSGLTLGDADKRIDEYYPQFIKNRSVTILIEQKAYSIDMAEISVRINKTESINAIMQPEGIKRLVAVAKGIFVRDTQTINPYLYCNESLLKKKLYEFKLQIDRAPIDAYITLKDDLIEKKPEVYGVEMNVDKCLNSIKDQLQNGNIGPIELKVGVNADYKLIRPKSTMADIDVVNTVLGKAHTDIIDGNSILSLKFASKAIDNVFIPKKNQAQNGKVNEFSFYKFLQDDGYKMKQYNQGVNQVATTLYKALLDAGIQENDISFVADTERIRNNISTKRVKVIDNETDFKFRNTNYSPIIIISNIKNSLISVYVLGKGIEKEKDVK